MALLTEDDIRQYFINQGGICRNNELVTYFRDFLSNPSNRDEARALFKSYVNKLATMKVENGEKFLVLKRQFYPMDESGLPSSPATMRLGQGYENAIPPMSSGLPQHNQYPYQGPPPYVPVGGFPPLSTQSSTLNYFPQLQQQSQMSGASNFSPPMQELPFHMSKSQPSLHGSHFSLNSNASSYLDPHTQQSPSANFGMYSSQSHNAGSNAQSPGMGDYPLKYGLPPPPSSSTAQTVFPPRRLSFSSPPSNFGHNSSTTSASRLPPPYRPPPPAYVGSPPPPASAVMSVRSPIILRNPLPSNDSFGLPGPVEITGRSQYRRSLSATGLNSSGLLGSPKTNAQSATCSSAGENLVPFFSATGSPPPPVPPRAKRQSSFLEKSPSFDSGATSKKLPMEELNKENSKPVECSEEDGQGVTGVNGKGSNGGGSAEGTANGNSELEQKISVRERMQKFNRAGEGELPLVPKLPNGNAKGRKDLVSKHESADYDTASLSSYGYGYQAEPKSREWILKAARLDYHGINKMAQETPSLVKRRDINGYTALHWAAKHGHVELVKLLAGTFRSDVHSKSNGGYTPLHLAAQFSRQEVYDILVKAYNADPDMRDHSGKKPKQYMVRQDSTAVSNDTFKSESESSIKMRPNSSASVLGFDRSMVNFPTTSSRRSLIGVSFGDGDSSSKPSCLASSGGNALSNSYHPDLASVAKARRSSTASLVHLKPEKNTSSKPSSSSFRIPFTLAISDMRRSFRQGIKRIADKGAEGRDAF